MNINGLEIDDKFAQHKDEDDFIYKLRLNSAKLDKEIDVDWEDIVEFLDLSISGTHLRKLSYGWREVLEYFQLKGEDGWSQFKKFLLDLPDKNRQFKEFKGEENVSSNSKTLETLCGYSSCLSNPEDKIQVFDNGTKLTFNDGKREVKISKDKVKKIKELYCDDNPLNINEVCRKLNIPRRDFNMVKTGLNIVHNDVPYLDQDITDNNIDSLVDTTLERRKEKYFIKLQQQEIRKMKQELGYYRREDYIFNNVVKRLNSIVITPNKYNAKIKKIGKHREALIDLMDLHLGIKINNYWNKYSVDEAKKRAEFLTRQVIQRCAEAGANVLHLSCLGDFISGLIHQSLHLQQEIDVAQQVEVVAEILEKMIAEFADSNVFDKVVVASVVGNHGRMIPQKDSSIDRENFEYLIYWGIKKGLKNLKNVIFEDNFYDDGIIVKEICGVTIFECHGHNGQVNRIAGDLSMMIKKPDEIHLGHFHQNKSFENICVEIFIGRSFSGTDEYAKDKNLFSKAGQRLFLYEDGKRLSIQDIVFN
ncbi:Phage related protein [Clostridium acetobutylicum EA 2018]|uniref:Phage related protein, YonJ B.subtilis homolog n=1 Tax=Clostridium acetobutylicum (strain ATCC 824 / DSM 792 / JCM 1419 / IAM 19013 / LMG 5710 / NBRC 13948 / NRRL B-527 / VKM B-1787 / 2291 / W) TaxID=272562 RepID=Q97JY6_CLOAB|nr:Phage related protein, YonJ B.subtilis homolog [Clostridium acetobutylicum ATCC 824]ADZ20185.1 Phage related protein [Clostridium acetobutylicum EA 2018]AEI31645.1 hypothetical protein SMB_G1155 [Clostridium acetobutylicum DSM 1731]AWV81637.1 hypothetical protein DK921_16375 [Clostridium acetobutylicum]PSM04922.1 hypothetical protein C7T89_16370 [Clostridium sp. NJ4]